MSFIKRFNDEFGIKPSVSEEQARFLNRLNTGLFPYLEDLREPISYGTKYCILRFELGLPPASSDDLYGLEMGPSNPVFPRIYGLCGMDINRALLIIDIMYSLFQKDTEVQEDIKAFIRGALDRSAVDIGIRWDEGFFYKSGSELLDARLIDDPLGCLKKYPKVRDEYVRAVKDYSTNELKEMAQKCFIVVEELARGLLGNSQTLDKNRDALLSKLALSDEWKRIIGPYLIYIHEYSRHGGSVRKELSEREAEALLYVTGLLVRLIVKAMNNGA